MLSDNIAIALALVAVTLARRPSTPTRSFGLQRAEILAAFVNGLTLVLVSGWIVWKAVERFDDTPEILGGWMLVVALLGLLVNASAAWILIRSAARASTSKRPSDMWWPTSSALAPSSSQRS